MILASFFAGIFSGTFGVAGLFFLRFWKTSGDPFFLNFAIACWLLVIERIAVLVCDGFATPSAYTNEGFFWVYLIRLSAFAMIFFAILKKNRNVTKK